TYSVQAANTLGSGFVSDPNIKIDPTAHSLTSPILNGVLNPGVGLDNTGVTDVHAAIQASLDAGTTDFYFPAGTYNIGTVGISIPSTVQRFVMSPGAKFVYSGTGIAVLINGTGTANAAPIQPEIRIQVTRT